MSKELVISANRHETRVAMIEDEQVVEIYHQRENEYSLAGSIHKGRVTRVLPGMQSAFVDIGLDRDAFLYVSDFFEDNDEYDKIVSSVEEKVLKLDKPGVVTPPVAIVTQASAVDAPEAPVDAPAAVDGGAAAGGRAGERGRRSARLQTLRAGSRGRRLFRAAGRVAREVSRRAGRAGRVRGRHVGHQRSAGRRRTGHHGRHRAGGRRGCAG